MKATQEHWLPVVGHESSHEVSDLGRIRSIDRRIKTKRGSRQLKGRILPIFFGPYAQVTVTVDYEVSVIRAHVAVAEAFIGAAPDGMEVCHNDGDRANNAVTNLRYDTHAANCQDTVQMGRNVLARRTHCKNNHEYTAETTRPRAEGGRRCLLCHREAWRRYVDKKEAA